jgi:hypothetical protein
MKQTTILTKVFSRRKFVLGVSAILTASAFSLRSVLVAQPNYL